MKRPNTCANLVKAINQIAVGRDPVRLSREMANVIVGQMLPDGVVKGGSSLLFRYGERRARYTRDVDTARVTELADYVNRLEAALALGWNGFTGRLVPVAPPEPEGVPRSYVMIPYDVKLSYLKRPWQTVRVEVGHNEVGDADEFEESLPPGVAADFEALSFPAPKPLPLMKIPHQVAQKLHAVSESGSERAHDLIDLQLIAAHETLNLADVRSKCVRLFDYRRKQAWPPRIMKGLEWNTAYAAARATIADASHVLATVDEAVAWANDLIGAIDGAGRAGQ